MKLLKNLPSILGKSREELLSVLLSEEYGFLPSSSCKVSAELQSRNEEFLSGKAELQVLKLICDAAFGSYAFPIYYVRPNQRTAKLPAIIHINFRDSIPDQYQPTEELIDAGFAVLTVCYKDVTDDNDDFTNGLAGVVYPNGQRGTRDCGKIGLWAWACMRMMDYALTLPELDAERISVAGHSRLGKTALLAGALDPRFYCAYSNDSGCSGAALSRQKEGETIKDIVTRFPYWFCQRYADYVDREEDLPFDQHALLAANAPHYVYVASASDDAWAYPKNEYLSCVAVSEYFESLGLAGFVHPDRLPEIGDRFHEGTVGYHLRAGKHFFDPEDWQGFLAFLKSKEKN